MKIYKNKIKLFCIASMCGIFLGCGAGSFSNSPMEIRDDRAISYQAGVEIRPVSRLVLRGQYTAIDADAEMHLDNSPTFDVVRANDTLWEGPLTLNQDVNFQTTNLIIMGSPVNNKLMEFNIGAGFQFMRGELKLSGQGKQTTLNFAKDSGATFNTELKFKITPELALGGAFTGSFREDDYDTQMYELNVYWTPIKNFRFNLGLFQYSFENYVDSTNDSTSDYQMQYRRISRSSYEGLETCEDNNEPVCPSGDYDSELDIFTEGLKAGVTFVF